MILFRFQIITASCERSLKNMRNKVCSVAYTNNSLKCMSFLSVFEISAACYMMRTLISTIVLNRPVKVHEAVSVSK